MKFTRLPRFKRAPVVGPQHLKKRDRQIIRLVYRYRFLLSCQIVILTGGIRQVFDDFSRFATCAPWLRL
jgi:hypothetical protein